MLDLLVQLDDSKATTLRITLPQHFPQVGLQQCVHGCPSTQQHTLLEAVASDQFGRQFLELFGLDWTVWSPLWCCSASCSVHSSDPAGAITAVYYATAAAASATAAVAAAFLLLSIIRSALLSACCSQWSTAVLTQAAGCTPARSQTGCTAAAGSVAQ